MARLCAVPGCRRALGVNNTWGLCVLHMHYRDYCGCPHCQRVCAAPGCDNRLKSYNQSGRCVHHARSSFVVVPAGPGALDPDHSVWRGRNRSGGPIWSSGPPARAVEMLQAMGAKNIERVA